ncbi:hypothetical protein [Reyranella sp.]|uniref:hypothetical protein n=1 Tax=Reyranella sp. TaxID=1929291 RepID=UPI003BA891AD
MHIDLEIDHDRRLVIARAQGALQLPDITGYFARLVFDQTLGYAKIFDGRKAWLDLADHHVGLLKGHVRAMGSRGPRGPVAIVATTPRGIDGARLFMQMPAADRTAQLFESIDAARNWLGPQGEAPVEPAPALSRLVARPLLTASGARERAGKARRLAWEMSTIEDRDRLLDYARELDEQAALLEGSIARSA